MPLLGGGVTLSVGGRQVGLKVIPFRRVVEAPVDPRVKVEAGGCMFLSTTFSPVLAGWLDSTLGEAKVVVTFVVMTFVVMTLLL